MNQEEMRPFAEGDQVVGEVVTIFAAIAVEYKESHVASYHLTHHDAVIGASGLGYLGPDGRVQAVLALKLADGRFALAPQIVVISENHGLEKLQEQARKKLTPAELAALRSGLRD